MRRCPRCAPSPELAAEWEPLLTSQVYEHELRPGRREGAARWPGWRMTEKQGGSDVRANTTRAEPLAAAGEYVLTGHKWFCSAPMSDAFLVLAQAPGGLTCFLLPRVLPDGSRNSFRIQRLKDKLGNRSNASAEVEFDGTTLGAPGRRGGARRGDDHRDGRGDPAGLCHAASAAVMRQAVAQAAAPHARTGRRSAAADRQAADAQCAGRPGAGVGGGDRPSRCGWRRRTTREHRAGRGTCCGWRCRRRSTG